MLVDREIERLVEAQVGKGRESGEIGESRKSCLARTLRVTTLEAMPWPLLSQKIGLVDAFQERWTNVFFSGLSQIEKDKTCRQAIAYYTTMDPPPPLRDQRSGRRTANCTTSEPKKRTEHIQESCETN